MVDSRTLQAIFKTNYYQKLFLRNSRSLQASLGENITQVTKMETKDLTF